MASPRTQPGPGGEPPRRGRPPRISRKQIAEAAVELGLRTFSMQAIADRLGVTPPALYTHVSGRDAILELVAADLIGRFEISVEQGADWGEWLSAFAHEMRRQFSQVGTSLRIDLADTLTPAHLEVSEQGFRLLVDAGFTAADAGRAIWLAARIAMTAGSSENVSVHMAMSEASRVIDRAKLPTMSQALDDLGAEKGMDTFEFDLHVLREGLRAYLPPRTRLST